MKRVHLVYSGNVQGVGFRFTTVHIAESLNIKGWVKNLPNGDVEVIAEGESDNISQFIDSLEERMSGYIQSKDMSQEEVGSEFNSFDIKY